MAKTLRDSTDRAAQAANETEVSAQRLLDTANSLGMGPGVDHAAKTNTLKVEKGVAA